MAKKRTAIAQKPNTQEELDVMIQAIRAHVPQVHETLEHNPDYLYSSESELMDAFDRLESAGFAPNILHNALMISLGYYDNNHDIVTDTYLNLLTFAPNITMDQMTKRWYCDPSQYPKLSPAEVASIRDTADIVQSRRKNRKKDPSYAKGLKLCYSYLHDDLDVLPVDIMDALDTRVANPDYANHMFALLQVLFPLLDGGLQQMICNKKISSQTWMIAMSLYMASSDNDAGVFVFAGNESHLPDWIKTRLDNNWPTIVALGLMVHQLEMLQSPAITAKLYEMHRDPAKGTNEIKSLKKDIDQSRQEATIYRKKCEILENENKQLRLRLDQAPSSSKDIDGIIERQQQTIRDLNAEIERMRGLMSQMEEENAELEHQLYLREAAEHQDKPWMDIDLPETNVLFVGGNPNCNKKWRSKYHKWSFISTENPNAALPGKVEVIFLCVDHKVSHPLWYRINEIYQNRSKMCYVQATNLDRLNEEMHYEYWKLLQKK